jgi:hypothetical protein
MGRALVHNDADFPKGAGGEFGLYPNMPYRPVLGLVELFGRASTTPGNPRALIIKPCSTPAFSYATVVMHPSESGREFGQQQ